MATTEEPIIDGKNDIQLATNAGSTSAETNITIHPPGSPQHQGGVESMIQTMSSTAIHGTEHLQKAANWAGDGNDSGVEAGTVASSIELQRALSSNSAGYASSSGGLEAPIGNASCNSSILSFCSDSYEGKPFAKSYKLNQLNNDCTSEGGSESSSVSGGATNGKRNGTVKRKIEAHEMINGKKIENSVARSRARAASASRASVQCKSVGAPNLATQERARTRDKSANSYTPVKTPTIGRSLSLRRAVKPDTLPTGLRDLGSPAVQRVTILSRTPSLNRGRTPGATPGADDRRWTPSGTKSNGCPPRSSNRGRSTTPENIVIKTKYGPMVLENKSVNSIEKFATLPRRRKERSVEDLHKSSRSNSIVRDRLSNSSKRSLSKESSPQKSFPPHGNRGRPPKTKIYHETSVQTAMTSKDIDEAFTGKAKEIKVDAVQLADRGIQVDIRDRRIEQLEDTLRKMLSENENLQSSLSQRSHVIEMIEQHLVREREEKASIKNELKRNTERVLSMLESAYAATPQQNDESCDSLLMLESQIQLSGHALEKKQVEIDTLRGICRDLQEEMKRSFNEQQNLLLQKESIERETTELEVFLQDEKTAVVEALKEAETEIEQYQHQLEKKEVEIERLRDECRHLVRISEQRKQEFLGMQSKYTALESRSKEMVVQQSSTISCATSALTCLTSRLNSLVEQLITSYNISEQELEDLVYHNEVYAISSEDGSPESELGHAMADGSHSPQRHQSFIKAVLSAIKSAAITAKSSVNKKLPTDGSTAENEVDESDSTDMLDSETEPCLMMENVLEDVSMPDSHSHNMVSSTNAISFASEEIELNASGDINQKSMNKEEESLYNLCQAIANRQEIEHQTNMIMNNRSNFNFSRDASMHESIAELPLNGECSSSQALVDQIIDVDNLVTKLLKILRIIQIEDDHCIQRLIGEKNALQLNQGEANDKFKELELVNIQLKLDLEVTSKQLMINSTELAHTKIELQNHRNEINRLNEDICSLSTLCSQSNMPPSSKYDFMNVLHEWKDKQDAPKPELLSHILAACSEIPILQELLQKKEQVLTELSNNHVAGGETSTNCQNDEIISEVKRQHEAIQRAIDTLNCVQSIVDQWSMPKVEPTVDNIDILINSGSSADCNANGPNNESVHTSDTNSPNNTIDLIA